MARKALAALCVGVALVLAACSAPKSFVRVSEPGWAAVELAPGVNPDQAWESVVDILAKKFDLEMISKEGGYIRTGWSYTWTGERTENYRVRATVKFTPKRDQVQIRSEAEYGKPGKGELGTDDSLLATLKTDIAGAIARTTR
jgi:hypothetical protein